MYASPLAISWSTGPVTTPVELQKAVYLCDTRDMVIITDQRSDDSNKDVDDYNDMIMIIIKMKYNDVDDKENDGNSPILLYIFIIAVALIYII